jgi:hypothetical protein
MFHQTLSIPGPRPEWQSSAGPSIQQLPPDAPPASLEANQRPPPAGRSIKIYHQPTEGSYCRHSCQNTQGTTTALNAPETWKASTPQYLPGRLQWTSTQARIKQLKKPPPRVCQAAQPSQYGRRQQTTFPCAGGPRWAADYSQAQHRPPDS